jgi:hypothetical protein
MANAQENCVLALGRSFGVEVVRSDSRIPDDVDGVIAIGASDDELGRIRSTGLPVLSFGTPREATSGSGDPVVFSGAECAPSALRGRSFGGIEPRRFQALHPHPGEQVLATLDGLPILTATGTNGRRSLRCGLPCPTLEAKEALFDCVNPHRFPLLVPALEFLRDLTDEQSWLVALRASLMMDDPNLHWPTYGCIKYGPLAASGATRHYHTAMATVPLDGWFTHPRAARVFRQNPGQLSLLVHGNNHTHAELAQKRTAAECVSYLRLAEQRVRRLEAKAGVPVSRVMAAPHGACSETMLSAMVDVGFEAAVVSAGSLRRYNPGRPWLATLGIAATENIGGLPVIPRFRITADCQSRILAAAYLRQPIIPVGHHWDLLNGLGLLESTADFINSLGAVEWCDLRTLSRSNYATRLRGDELQVRLYSRRVTVSIGPAVRRVRIEKSWSSDSESDLIDIRRDGASLTCERDGEGVCTALDSEGIIEIDVRRTTSIPQDAPLPAFRVWPITRRVLGECRDRLYPLRASLRLRTRPKG